MPEPHKAKWTARLLEEALDAVTGERNRDYGDPWDNHQRTAEAWAWWLKHRHGVDLALTDLDVCMLNILQKQSRLAQTVSHDDSWKDIAGFAGNAGACMDHAKERLHDAAQDQS
jgi:hypothetical protein